MTIRELIRSLLSSGMDIDSDVRLSHPVFGTTEIREVSTVYPGNDSSIKVQYTLIESEE